MGNIITNEKINDSTILMSNGLTSVFIETICLAGSDIALEKYQQDIMIWFSQRDWMILGMGFEGFDIGEIVWRKEIFYEQQRFILKVIDRATEKTNWDLLNYTPGEMIFETLTNFRQMIQDFRIEHIETENEIPIFDFDGIINRYDKCDKHSIYKHYAGCVICNR
ncbi:hypothetical protein SAMN04488505_1021140 [Chitinophaga rupis]|uniref:Uncharacterized protein n=1 Tax=Chitinophaga rupis TaxID=573321 RepID=A0A1H7T515_9BACT|nr:hypothetical protein [Chitinophaga rupis]SEL79893.1 hypothetical protein SAMN04488505_1021140 [Chitinophaga rupis]